MQFWAPLHCNKNIYTLNASNVVANRIEEVDHWACSDLSNSITIARWSYFIHVAA